MSTDSRATPGSKKGDIPELQEELNHQKEERRRDALKKVIAAMTVGKDVSMLFTDVLNCIQTTNLELKKLVYLYVINHAKMQPDRAILAVNTFQRDTSDPNPLIRALAIRTMGCIRVDKVTEYLTEPLRACLKDKDPYVRKTAAICVAKLYDMNPDLVQTGGFLESLLQLLSDSNPSVVANAVAALTEIDELSSKGAFSINSQTLSKLTTALNECTEWGQVFILNAMAKYSPVDSKEAEALCDRVSPRLNHGNSAVVLASVKVLMVFMEHIKTPEVVKAICKKMAPPLVTLLTTKEPEIQYVALRNIIIIAQKRPNILAHEMRVFFIKYNDPIYVKMEKLEIMIMLSSEKNIDQVLNEFKEAASEVDVEFVRKAVRAIGRCAIKIEKAAERCIQVLLELIQTKVNYVVQEAVIVIKDIFRKYPNRYESIISTLCENLDTLDEPEAKASMIWIIGEYAERIDNADELLESFNETFADETAQVQLQLLTATVKLFLKRPKDTQEMVQKVLNKATQETDNPDLRDRGYVYWRLLSTDPEAAKNVVLGDKPLISDSTTLVDASMLQDLIENISSLASIYHKPADSFISKSKDQGLKPKKDKKKKIDDESLLPKEEESGGTATGSGAVVGNILDLDSIGDALPSPSSTPSSPKPAVNEFDFFNAPVKETPVVKELVLPADRGYGLQVAASFSRRDSQIYLDLTLSNHTQIPMTGFAIQFNKNSFSLVPSQPTVPVLMPGQSVEASLLLGTHPNQLNPNPPTSNVIQVAMKVFIGEDKVVYFHTQLPLHTLFLEAGQLDRDEYLNLWKNITEEHFKDVTVLASTDANIIQKKLEANRLFYIARRTVNQQEFLYFSARIPKDNAVLLVELAIGNGACRICSKTANTDVVPLLEQSLASILAR